MNDDMTPVKLKEQFDIRLFNFQPIINGWFSARGKKYDE